MSLQNIPAELRQRRQWVCAHDDKIPRTPRTGAKADPTDPATWGTFEEACQTGMKHIGYVLHKDDPYSAIDLDDPEFLKKDHPDPDPDRVAAKKERHQYILDACGSYAELSQSGSGVHILVRGKIPNGVRRDCVEVYSDGRYMICTGNRLNELPITEQQEMLDILYGKMSTTSKVSLTEEDELMSDEALWEMGQRAANGDKFEKLWKGDWQDYPSQSEADFALMSMLCYYSKSNEQCRRVFRMSELGKRDKAQRNKYLDYMITKCRSHEPAKVDLTQLKTNADAAFTKPKPQPPGTIVVLRAETGEELVGHDASIDDTITVAPLAHPPGLVGEIADYVLSSSIRPVKEISLATALAFTAGVCGRSYNVSGTGLNQYIILLAQTGRGKEAPSSAINRMVAALRSSIPMADRFIGPAAFASGQGLVRVLDERPCFVSILGEFGTTLQILCDPRANEATRMLKKVVLDLYNKSGFNEVLRGTAYSDSEKNTKMVHAPNVTILGESTPEELYGHLDLSHVTSGLLPRFSIIEYNGPRPPKNPNAFHPPSEDLVNRLGELVTIALTTQQNRTCCPIQLDADAKAVLDEFDDYADKQINHGGQVDRELWNRAHLKALKMASLIAVGNNPQNPTVDKAAAVWACDFVYSDINALSAKFLEGDIGEGYSKQEVDMKNCIRDYRKMTWENRRGYKVPESLIKEPNVIPFHFIRKRLRMVSSFKNDRRGFAAALETLLDNLVRAESLVLIDRGTAKDVYGCSQPLYGVGPTF